MKDARNEPCPGCGAILPGSTYLGEDERVMPHEGDLVVCAECMTPARVDAQGNLKRIVESDIDAMDRDEMLRLEHGLRMAKTIRSMDQN